MKYKLVTAFLAFSMIGFGCTAPINEPEPEVTSEIMELTFGDFDALPEWLQDLITTVKAGKTPDGHFIAEKGEWGEQTIYNTHSALQSVMIEFRYENGEKIDESLVSNARTTSKNWEWVYEWASGFSCQMFGKGIGTMSGPRTKGIS